MNQQDRNVLQMLMVVVGALVAFMIVIIIAAKFISGSDMSDKSQDPMVKAATEERIKPIASVTVGAAPAPAAGGAVDGAALYTANCAACHDTGAAGAPKVGDKAAWKSRIGQGMDVLLDHATNGFNAMPPRGGSSLDDDAIKAVVKHMVDSSK